MRKIIRCSNVGKDARYNKVTVEQEKEALKKLNRKEKPPKNAHCK